MSYGAEIKNGANQIRLTPEDFLDLHVVSGRTMLVWVNANTRFEQFVSVPEMLNNGRWAVSLWAADARCGIETGGFRIISSVNDTPVAYMVVRRGSV